MISYAEGLFMVWFTEVNPIIQGLIATIFTYLVMFALTMRNALPFALSFSAGAMIAVVCSELIPESFRDNKIIAALGVLFGFSVMMVLDVALG